MGKRMKGQPSELVRRIERHLAALKRLFPDLVCTLVREGQRHIKVIIGCAMRRLVIGSKRRQFQPLTDIQRDAARKLVGPLCEKHKLTEAKCLECARFVVWRFLLPTPSTA